MILSKNIYGDILSKEYINDEIKYQIGRKNKLYTVYAPNNGRFDFDIKDTVYISYQKSKILWGKKKVVLASKNVGEMTIKGRKRFMFNDVLDIAFFLIIGHSVSLVDFPTEFHSIDEVFVYYNIGLIILLFLFFVGYKYLKSIHNNNIFFSLYRKQRLKNKSLLKYNKYVKENFSLKERMFNKKLNEEDKNNFKIFIQKEETEIEDKIIIDSIIDETKITVRDINNIDTQKLKKQIEIKEKAYNS